MSNARGGVEFANLGFLSSMTSSAAGSYRDMPTVGSMDGWPRQGLFGVQRGQEAISIVISWRWRWLWPVCSSLASTAGARLSTASTTCS